MNEKTLKSFKEHLIKILDFVEGRTESYTYISHINKSRTIYYDLKQFPSLFLLMLSNKELCKKFIKDIHVCIDISRLSEMIIIYLYNINCKWNHFTRDDLYPVPLSFEVDNEFNPNHRDEAMKRQREGTLWNGDMKTLHIEYIKHILKYIDITLQDLNKEEYEIIQY